MKDNITICIPTYNSLPTIRIVLGSLNFQDIYPRIIVLDNGSKDGTFEALGAILYNKFFPDLNIELRHFGQISLRKFQNMDIVRHKLVELVKTKYMMFIDSDVLLPPYVIRPMLEVMNKRPDVGMLGLKYDVNTNHVKLGATILRTKPVKDLVWRRTDTECQCNCCAKHLLLKGFKVEHYQEQLARHLLAF
jgi:glycosyltransferase involved in cell wall biosynthesis